MRFPRPGNIIQARRDDGYYGSPAIATRDSIHLAVRLRQAPGIPDVASALFVRGDSVVNWLNAAAQHNLATNSLQFCPLAAATHNHIHGVLILGQDFDTRVSSPSIGTPYVCRANQLYIPGDAALQPVISDEALAGLLPADKTRILVWHPGLGLIGFDHEHVLSTADLLRCPSINSVQSVAVEPTPPDEFDSQSAPTPNAHDILLLGGDDIGTEANEIDNAPRSPDEKSGAPLRDAASALQRGIAKAVHGVTSRLPSTPHGNQLLRRLHEWARQQSGTGSGTAGTGYGPGQSAPPQYNLSAKRENELKRLLHMLENDPDRGLRFAIPSAGARHHGGAPPGDTLGEQSSDFHLDSLNRTGPADVWDVPWEYQVKLIHHYRRLAEREQRYGRARRAAWIYAHLLNDLHSAARALESGGLHHDAAMVWMQHLHEPLKAAAAFRCGGFYEQALQIYRNHDHWLDAGDVLKELRQPEAAREAFLREIGLREDKLDFVGGADVAQSRLADPDLATALLTTGWMKNSHAKDCLRQLLQLQADHARHDDAISFMDQLTAGSVIAADQVEDATKVVSECAVNYPNEAVRIAARRHTWRLAASLVNRNPGLLPLTAMASIRQLASSDRLLKTDTHRFQSAVQDALCEQQRKNSPHTKSSAGAILFLTRYIPAEGIPPSIEWFQVVGSGPCVFRYGRTDDMTDLIVRHRLLARQVTPGLSATSDILQLRPRDVDAIRGMPVTMRTLEHDTQSICLQPLPGPSHWCFDRLNREALHATEFAQTILPEINFVLDLAPTSGKTIHVLADSEDEGLRMVIIGPDGLARTTTALPEIERLLAETPESDPRSPLVLRRIFVHPRSQSVVLGRFLFRVENQSSRCVYEFPNGPRHVVQSPPTMVPRLAFSHDEGVTVVWPTTGESCQVASDLSPPAIGFTSNGLLVVGCPDTGTLTSYRLYRGQVSLTGRYIPERSTPVHFIVPGPNPGQFIAIDESGLMRLYACPAG